jgi:hypothetical protein
MNSLILTVVLILLISLQLVGQPANVTKGSFVGNIDTSVYSGSSLSEVSLPPPELIGNTYLNTGWNRGDIELYGGKVIRDQWIRYDLKRKALDVHNKGYLLTFEASFVKSYTTFGSAKSRKKKYINVREFATEGVAQSGLFEILDTNGSLCLVVQTVLEYKASNYNQILDAGTNEDIINKRALFYIALEKEIHPLSRNKKEFYAQFREFGLEVMPYVKENRLNIKKQEDLVMLIDYANDIKN